MVRAAVFLRKAFSLEQTISTVKRAFRTITTFPDGRVPSKNWFEKSGSGHPKPDIIRM